MRSRRYQKAASLLDKKKEYPIAEAVKLVKATAKVKFDESVEVHACLGIDPKKGEQAVRGSVILPHGTGQNKRVAVFSENEESAKQAGADLVGGEALVKKIKTSGKADFDVALATPAMMKILAQAAKILGPKGLMPSPKSGTVVSDKDLPKAIEEIKKGKVNFRNDDTANIHQVIGKASWPEEKLAENFEVLLQALEKAKPQGLKGIYLKHIYLASSMGPSVRVAI